MRSEISSSSSRSSLTRPARRAAGGQVEQRLVDRARPRRHRRPRSAARRPARPGSCSISRPTMNFCRLPPERLRAVRCAIAGACARRSRGSAARRSASAARPVDQPARAPCPCAASRSAPHCRPGSCRARRRGRCRSSGHEGEPQAAARAGAQRPTGLPSSRIASGDRAGVSPESAASSSSWPLPATPAMPRISPRAHARG